MEKTILQDKPLVIDKKLLTGRFQLTIKPKGPSRSFGGRMLTAYKHPLTQKMTHLTDASGQQLQGYLIEKLSTILRPDDNLDDRFAIEWLMAHPEVTVENIQLDSRFKKSANNPIKIINLDQQDLKELDDEDMVHRVIGRLSQDGGPEAIGLKKLRWLLAYFNLPYFDMKNISNPEVEKRFLRKKIKNFAQNINPVTKKFNAYDVADVLKQIDTIEINYHVKEMIRKHIVVQTNGYFRYDNIPLGTSLETVAGWFLTNANIYHEALGRLVPLLKREGFTT